MAVSPNGYTDDFGPNVANILSGKKSGLIKSKVPARVRADLRAAVKAGVLGHLPKVGLKPEIFFHPAHRGSSMEMREREAAYAVSCIAKVVGIKPVERRIEEAFASFRTTDETTRSDVGGGN